MVLLTIIKTLIFTRNRKRLTLVVFLLPSKLSTFNTIIYNNGSFGTIKEKGNIREFFV